MSCIDTYIDTDIDTDKIIPVYRFFALVQSLVLLHPQNYENFQNIEQME